MSLLVQEQTYASSSRQWSHKHLGDPVLIIFLEDTLFNPECSLQRLAAIWATLLPCRETDPANNVLLNMVCNTRLYQSIRSLVGNRHERVGLRHVRTPLYVVIMTVCLFPLWGNHPMGG